MAVYDYRCSECGRVEEIEKPMLAIVEVTCSSCDHSMIRVWHPTAVSFKGSGFYRTDSRTVHKSVKTDIK